MTKKTEGVPEQIEEAFVEVGKKITQVAEDSVTALEENAGLSKSKKKKNAPEKIEEALAEAGQEIVGVLEDGTRAVEEDLGASKKDAGEEDKKDRIEKLKAKLKEKAKALEGKVSEAKKINIKEEVRGEKEDKKDTHVPIEEYLKSSIHLGTRVITPDMRSYVYRRRADGLAVFNTALLDDKIREGADYLATFSPEDIIIVCKREAGWKAVQKFASTLGIKSFT